MMRRITISSFVLTLVTAAWAGDGVKLGREYGINYQVVIADEPSVEVYTAAWELVAFLVEVTEQNYSIAPASRAQSDYQIIVGRNEALEDLKLDIDWDSLGPDGFVMRTVGKNLVIAGGPRRGTINGVYTFLEEIVGCRWYTPWFSVIPNNPKLSISGLNTRTVPVFEGRNLTCGAASDVSWAARQRLNRFTSMVVKGIRADGKQVVWGAFRNNPKLVGSYFNVRAHVHTLAGNNLLPHAEFDEHPEYFALVDGKRLREGQPCFTNPAVVPVITKRAIDWIKSDPGARIISISQGDFRGLCRCSRCVAAEGKYNWSGMILRLVNQVAAEIEKYDPQIRVSTLASNWSREPPKGVVARRNVLIRYAPISACCYHAYDDDECERNTSYGSYKMLVDWANISQRVWVWSYAMPFDDLHPYPMLRCLSRNFKRMRDAGVQGQFVQAEQGRWTQKGGLIDLHSYLFAKLLWDPDYDVDKGIKEFSRALYGAAAPYIISYVEMVNDSKTYGVRDSDFHPDFGGKTPVTTEKLREIDELFDKAEQAVAADPATRERVQLIRLSVQYAILLYADKDDPIRQKAAQAFFLMLKQAKVPRPIGL